MLNFEKNIEFLLIDTRGIITCDTDEMKNFIIDKTDGRIGTNIVKSEATGLRKELFLDILKKYFPSSVYSLRAFLVTVVKGINNDKHTRYMIFIDGGSLKSGVFLTNYIKNYIPIYYIASMNESCFEKNNLSKLSVWFRTTMGSSYSFVDIDYILYNNDKILVIEEKQNKNANFGIGQYMSYDEFFGDILVNSVDKKLFFLSKGISNDWFIREYSYQKDSPRHFNVLSETELNTNGLIEKIKMYLDLHY